MATVMARIIKRLRSIKIKYILNTYKRRVVTEIYRSPLFVYNDFVNELPAGKLKFMLFFLDETGKYLDKSPVSRHVFFRLIKSTVEPFEL